MTKFLQAIDFALQIDANLAQKNLKKTLLIAQVARVEDEEVLIASLLSPFTFRIPLENQFGSRVASICHEIAIKQNMRMDQLCPLLVEKSCNFSQDACLLMQASLIQMLSLVVENNVFYFEKTQGLFIWARKVFQNLRFKNVELTKLFETLYEKSGNSQTMNLKLVVVNRKTKKKLQVNSTKR